MLRPTALLVLVVTLTTCAVNGQSASPIRLEVDATHAPTGVLHSHMTIPAAGGSLTLAYPKWIPGEHAPGGPLSQVVRLVFSADGKPISWHRDDLDIYVFHVDVP